MEHAASHATSFHSWGPVLGIAILIAFGGVFLAIASLVAGQYRDPEAAKFDVAVEDSYPAEGEEQPVS